MPSSDVLIIGSGISGLSTAIKLAKNRPNLQIAVLAQIDIKETNAFYGQDGVATVWDYSRDSYDKHIADTLAAGDGLCDEEVVSMVVREGPQRVKELMDWGARFEEDQNRRYKLKQAEEHSENRILYYRNRTVEEIQRALVEKAASCGNILVIDDWFAVDLLTTHQQRETTVGYRPKCFGANVIYQKDEQFVAFHARVTIMASGHIGQVYRSIPNLKITSEDSIEVNLNGYSSIDQLYACGQCAYTGFHGAKPLASNNLLEVLVFAHRIARSIVEGIDDIYLHKG